MGSVFDFDKPALYAVMGNPVAHSKSPRIHSLFAAQTHQRLEYIAIQVDPGGFAQAVGQFAANGGKGLNITVPFKQEAWRLADERAPRAELAGAVNTFVIGPGGHLRGDNTDGAGLVTDLTRNHGVRIAGARVLLVGAGGAARGVLAPLLEQRPSVLHIANRTADRAIELAAAFGNLGTVRGSGFETLEDGSFDLIINATSASLHGELPPLADSLPAPGACCYDMMYGAAPTPFMQWAARRGAAKIIDGLGMLVEQAAESFFLWRGLRPQTAPVIETLRRELASNSSPRP